MTRRHRIPTIFNIYMVDVLCCALGCVILLWLLNLKDAKEKAEAANLTDDQLALARADLTRLQEKLKDNQDLLKAARDKEIVTAEQLARILAQKDRLEVDQKALQARLAELDRLLTALKVDKIKAEDLLAQKKKDLATLEKELTDALAKLAVLTTTLKDKELLAKDSAKSVEELLAQLRMVEINNKDLKKDAELVPLLRDRLAKAEAKALALEKDFDVNAKNLVGAKSNIQDLEKAYVKLLKEIADRNQELTNADRRIVTLQGEKNSLLELLTRTRAAAENRFAGVTLSGQRVVFLVDMSGSMELLDEKTPAVNKWSTVCESIAKVMRSLPDLKEYQVIAFSDVTTFPMGNDGRWLTYDDKKSADEVLRTLTGLKPKGGTNIYSAFQSAFRYRPLGLDAVYIFSDGLPSIDPGVTSEQLQKMAGAERSQYLSQRVRTALAQDWNRPQSGQPRVRVNAIGFFYESPEVGAFLWALTREHEGSFVGMSKP